MQRGTNIVAAQPCACKRVQLLASAAHDLGKPALVLAEAKSSWLRFVCSSEQRRGKQMLRTVSTADIRTRNRVDHDKAVAARSKVKPVGGAPGNNPGIWTPLQEELHLPVPDHTTSDQILIARKAA